MSMVVITARNYTTAGSHIGHGVVFASLGRLTGKNVGHILLVGSPFLSGKILSSKGRKGKHLCGR